MCDRGKWQLEAVPCVPVTLVLLGVSTIVGCCSAVGEEETWDP